MGSYKSRREQSLQRKLIPVNIVVCVLALVAALTLFLTPILKINFGKILRDEAIIETIFPEDEESNNEATGGIDVIPVARKIVGSVLKEAEGSISISAVSALKVMTSDDKADKVLDELLFDDGALVTKLINSLVDGIANLFEDKDNKKLIQDTLISAMTQSILNNVDDKETAEAIAKNVDDIVKIFNQLGEPDCDPAKVANDIVDKVEALLGDGSEFDDATRKEFVDTVQGLYDDTLAAVGNPEDVSIEAIICVAISSNMDLGDLNLGELFDQLGGDDKESSVHKNTVDEDVGEDDKKNDPVTSYKELLERMGFDSATKEELKAKMRNSLSNMLRETIEDSGITDFLEYYQYVFFAMLVFIVPWFVLFLFSFFHLLAKNKRFVMWYVKLTGWIPPLIWLALKLVPTVLNKVSPDTLEGDQGPLIKAVLGGVTSFTWISGLCYILLWLVSIFWAFPIKRKIRKERKHPDGSDEYDEDDGSDEYDDDYYGE